MSESIQRLLDIMARLRDPNGGCPWDLEQSFATIAPYTVEEAHEVAEAIARGDLNDLKDELGDLLLQVVFHAQMAKEQGAFQFDDVVAAICDKMIRRHPHVFGDAKISDAAEQTRAWEALKRAERGSTGSSLLDDVKPGLPEWTRARKLQSRAAEVGFDWPSIDPVFDKLNEEIGELRDAIAGGDSTRVHDELGDVLFVCANLARHLDLDPGQALKSTNAKFDRRFRRLEQLAQQRGIDLSRAGLAALDQLWDIARAEDHAAHTLAHGR
jgi:nucleoside triphosphate diphosphatase